MSCSEKTHSNSEPYLIENPEDDRQPLQWQPREQYHYVCAIWSLVLQLICMSGKRL
jgi:hypothetical protein